ncbi:MAG: TlpA family protein disulfide reductase [Bacteroidales bacterium]|jgi:thiol-disulfide isomerase/thioredoxin|nr:TlpA family protein disulfide reductase [Bacteroidales bacterium]
MKNLKNLIIITLCVWGLYNCSPERPAVVERPVFDLSSGPTLEIDKIEMSDSATVFHIDAYFRPHNWIRISKDTYIRESGGSDKLQVVWTEGINLDEETFMPESGTISFKLFFPPLKPEITKIDFIESDCPDCFKIWGIYLLPNARVTFDAIPQEAANTSSEPLPAPGCSTQPAKVSGRLLGYVDGMEPREVTFYTANIAYGERIEVKFPIAEDGSFSGEITPGMTGITSSSLGSVFLIPGREVKMYIDLKKRSRFLSRYRTDKEPGDSIYQYVVGSCFTSADLKAIDRASHGLFDYQQLMQETVNMKPEEFKQHIWGIMNRKLDEVKQKNYPAHTQMMVENSIKMEIYPLLMQYEEFVNAAYMQINRIKREDRDKVTFKPEKPDAEYYSFLKTGLNDHMSYLPGYLYLTDALADIDYFNLPDGNDKPAKERFACFREKFAPDADQGVLFDVVQSQFYGRQLSDMKLFTDADKQELRAAFKDRPAYAETLIAESDKMAAVIAANRENKESIVNELPKVTQEKMFDAVLAGYKGKVVVVDFWATWCGPCMQAMKAIHPLKEEMKGKDVVFLYLTGETSPLNTWTKTYPGISGEHYRVSEAQWGYWYKTYGIDGIPTYMIYNRQGKQQARYTGFPGVEKMKADIEKAI